MTGRTASPTHDRNRHTNRHTAGARSHRPAVVEHVDLPQSTSDGRATSRTRGLGTQIATFTTIGIFSTAAWALLYLILRGVVSSLQANAVALIVTAIGNTAANRYLTFGVRSRATVIRDHAAGLAAFGIALGLTSGTAFALAAFAPHAGRLVELAVLATANLAATTARFVLLRAWVGGGVAAMANATSRYSLERIRS
jgi:putative flippase GtrA